MAWKRICCPIDFSEPSRVALMQAAELAKQRGGDLVVVSVLEVATAMGEDALAVAPELLEKLIVELRQRLDAWAREADAVAPGRVTAQILKGGPPASEILRFLGRSPCDLVVMGTRGRTGLAHLLLGSVAEKVVREAPCSVLVARPERIETTD